MIMEIKGIPENSHNSVISFTIHNWICRINSLCYIVYIYMQKITFSYNKSTKFTLDIFF